MMGKTHLAVGTAAAVLLLHPQSLPVLIAGAGAAAVGSLLPDIDVGTSHFHKDLVKVFGLLAFAAGCMAAAEFLFKIPVFSAFYKRSEPIRNAEWFFWAVFFAALCAGGLVSPHRSFTHSFPGLFLFSYCVGQVFPSVAVYFIVGYASHMLLDIFNKKGEQLFFPWKKTFCFGLLSSNGGVNRLLFYVGTIADAVIAVGYVLWFTVLSKL